MPDSGSLDSFANECLDYLDGWGVSPVIEIVIHGASLIDTAVDYRLRSVMIQGKTTDALLKPTGLLGNNSGKLQVLYCFGYITKDLLGDCTAIAGIRNIFAHQRKERSLDDPERLNTLRSLNIYKAMPAIANIQQEVYEAMLPPYIFASSCCLLAMNICFDAAASAREKALKTEALKRLRELA